MVFSTQGFIYSEIWFPPLRRWIASSIISNLLILDFGNSVFPLEHHLLIVIPISLAPAIWFSNLLYLTPFIPGYIVNWIHNSSMTNPMGPLFYYQHCRLPDQCYEVLIILPVVTSINWDVQVQITKLFSSPASTSSMGFLSVWTKRPLFIQCYQYIIDCSLTFILLIAGSSSFEMLTIIYLHQILISYISILVYSEKYRECEQSWSWILWWSDLDLHS